MAHCKSITEQQKEMMRSRSVSSEFARTEWNVGVTTYYKYVRQGVASGKTSPLRVRLPDDKCLCRICNHLLIERGWCASRVKKNDYLCTPCSSSISRASRRADVQTYMFKAIRQRALKSGIEFNIELDDIVVPEHCPMLGIKLEISTGSPNNNSPSLDRIVPSKGYVKGNIVVISYRANRIKNDSTTEELERILEWMKSNADPSE